MLNAFFKPIHKGDVFLNFIAGKWVPSSDNDTFHVVNPFKQEVIGSVQNTNPSDIKLAVESGKRGRINSASLTVKDRSIILSKCSKILREYKDEFVNMLALESGKPLVWSNGEVNASIEFLVETSKEALKIKSENLISKDKKTKVLISYKPVGLIAAITPFNYPLFSVVSKFASGFAGGNSIIMKPASNTPISALMFTKVAMESGVPKDVLNTVTGKSSKIGNSLVSDNDVNMVNLTGSTSAGESVLKNGGVKKYLLELGGKGAALILDDADLDLAAKECVNGCFKQSGQRCDAVSRVLIIDKLADKFVKKVLPLVHELKIGDPFDNCVSVGPLITENAVRYVKDLINDAEEKKAKVLIGGNYNGQVMEPTVIDYVTSNMRIAKEEIFGPVMPIIRVKDEAEAIILSNNSEYGLDSCVFSKSVKNALKVGAMLDDGSTTINKSPGHGIGEFPFGGNKKSGIGREGVKDSIYECMTKKVLKYY
ncbi:NAD(P)-dependent glyceraldehyde-3-phosphate dehydrogenase [Candidatus Tiddalikarchaeum anstoanum]|nr:NAD(P)-dependent glyceraldehyde-3-phosphate dehydrogenase [Candidatus Tiddalikarchaeum anstoanum]